MKKFIYGLVLGVALGVGGANLSDDKKDIAIEPARIEIVEKSPSYRASLGSKTLESMLEDGKAAPCFCQHEVPELDRWCEHENLYCDEDAAELCQQRYTEHICRPGIPARLIPTL
ncbi:hypothetical protein KFE80_09940 [bacterium SCSIO 12696]|nr:hypothetical protein KFE80_09940 [bacterium SCSIO 12696]